MKLSSRKKLLKESERVLMDIRKNVRKEKISEGVISDFLSNLVLSIVAGITKAVKTGNQSWMYYKMPYIMGLDLVNNKNIKIDRRILKELDKIINNIIKDVKTSPFLKNLLKELREYDSEVAWYRAILQNYNEMRTDGYKFSEKELKNWEEAYKKHKEAKKIFNDALINKSSRLIKNIIIQSNRYKNFDEMILNTLKSGIQGISQSEIDEIKEKYLENLAKRVSNYIHSYEYKQMKTSREVSIDRELRDRLI